MTIPTHEIYYEADGDLMGTAFYLPNGEISITVNGSFKGVFSTFENWNLSAGKGFGGNGC